MSHLSRLLERRPLHRIQWGLDRSRAMLRSLGDPHLVADSIHVGGTNGKGSAAALAEAALRHGGRRTGLYTSPHLSEFNERIRIGGAPADPLLLEDCAGFVLPAAEREDASYFEAATVLAFEAFRRSGCDAVIAEVGLGGRLDATNVLAPRVTVIASVDTDHTDYLGDTLEAIAGEKAGILKWGVPAVVGPLRPEPLEVVECRAAEIGAPLDLLGREMDAEQVATGLAGTSFRYRSDGWADGLVVRTKLVGYHQARNAALAIRTLERHDWGLCRRDIEAGMANLSWPGRFEILEVRGGTWVLDIAHNPAGVRVLAELLATLPLQRPIVALLSILGDKPWGEMLGPLLEVASAAVLTIAPSAPGERRWRPEEAQRVAGPAAEIELDFTRSLARARELAGEGTVVVTGSAHTVGDARKNLL